MNYMPQTGATTLLPEELTRMNYKIPRVWDLAAGLLKGKKRVDPLRYQRVIRRGWAKRTQRLELLASRKSA